MAGMSALGRRWAIATDDLAFVGLIDTIFFLFWVCWTSIVYSSYLESQCYCETEAECILLHVFLAGAMALSIPNLLISLLLIFFGTRGTIADPKPRSHVVYVVYIKFLVVAVLDVIWAILGSVLHRYHFSCLTFPVQWHYKFITAVLWFAFAARLSLIWMCYDVRGKPKDKGVQKIIHSEFFSAPVAATVSTKWKHRLQTMCFWFTTPATDRKVAISAVSELLAFISHDFDFVASDILAGFSLYRQKSIEKYKSEKAIVEASAPMELSDGTVIESFPTPDMPEWMNLKLAARYLTVSLGVFGWRWLLFRNFSCGLCQICTKLVCCFTCRRKYSNVKGDNICGCNVAGLKLVSGYHYEDLVHVCFVDKVFLVPFFVAIDNTTNSIIIVARGSMSCSDALTDIAAKFTSMEDLGCPKDSLAHGGVLLAARRIFEKLESKKILETAFTGRENYHLVVSGHSLGAGVASFLTMFLKASYPNVRCFAFTPPPVMNRAALPCTMDCIFSIVYGNDIVPYMNYWNIKGLLDDVSELLKECHVPKYKILLGCYNLPVGEKKESNGSQTETDGNSTSTAVISEKGQTLEEAQKSQDKEKRKSLPINPLPHTELLTPGRIIQISYTKNGYRLKLREADFFKTIVFRPNMLLHHVPHFLEAALNTLAEKETPSPVETQPVS